MDQKSTLHIYRKFKTSIEEEKWMDNTEGSRLLMKGRTNSLTLTGGTDTRERANSVPVVIVNVNP